MTNEFTGTLSVITGASQGIGLAVAEQLARNGSLVHNFDIVPPDAELPGVSVHEVDVTNETALRWEFSRISARVDILFCNAGVLNVGERTLFGVDAGHFRRMLDVNMFGSWLTLRTALSIGKLAPWATVVQMCSILGIEPRPEPRAYSLTKQMVHEYIKALRSDLPADSLNIKAVYAGPIDTVAGMARFESEAAYHAEMKRLYGGSTNGETVAMQILDLIQSNAADLVWDPDLGVHVLR